MKRILTLLFAVAAGALCLSWNCRAAVREVPPSTISTFLDAFPQTLRLKAALPVGDLPTATTWEFLAPGARPTYMWVPITNGPSLALPLLQSSDSGLYRAIAVDGYKADEARVNVSVGAAIAEVDSLRLEAPLQNKISALLTLPDGGIIRASLSVESADGTGFGLALHRADGSRNPFWDGLADVSPINLQTEASFLSIATQRTGGVIAGTADGRLVRVDPTGHWDVDFSTRNLFQSRVLQIGEDSLGRLVVATTVGLRRQLPNGSQDNGFQCPADLASASIQGFHLFPDDSMVVAFRPDADTNAIRVSLVWLRANGTLDADRLRMEFVGDYQAVNVISALPDQSILIGGIFDGLAGVVSPNLVRVMRTGVVDSSDGRQLPMNYYRNYNAEIRRIRPLARGGFVATGKSYVNGSGLATSVLFWSDSSGRLRNVGLPDLRYDDIDAVAEDSSGRILLGGSFSYASPGPGLQSSVRFFAVRLPDLFSEDVRPPIAPGNGRWLRAVAFRSSTTGFAVGDGGRVFRTDDGGRSWSSIPTGATNDLFTVAVEGPVVDVAGSAGFYARRVDGTPGWNRLTTGVEGTLRSMVGLPTGAGIVIGDSGTLLARTNGTFAVLDSGTTNDLLSIAGPVDQAFIAGRAGTILQLTTNGIAAIPSGTERDLTAIIDNSTPFVANSTALTDDGHVVWKGRVLQTQGSGSAYSAFRLIGRNLWAAGTNGVVEKDFALERALPSSAPIVALVPMGQQIHAYAVDGASFVMRESQTNTFTGGAFALLSPTNGQQVVKSNGTFSLRSTGAVVSAAWLVQDRAQGCPLVQRGTLGRGAFGPARLYVQSGDTLVGPVAINLVGPPELDGVGTPLQPLRSLGLENGSLVLASAVTAGGPLVFEWFKNGRRVVGATNASLSVSGLSGAQAGTYQLVVRSGDFWSTGAVALIVTNQAGATLLPRPPDQVLYARETIQFQIPQVAEPYSSASFSRVSDGKLVGVAPINATDSGSLKLVLTNSAGQIVGISEPAEIVVRNVTNRTIILSAAPATTNSAAINQSFNLIGYLAGGEESARFSLRTPATHRLNRLFQGFYFNAQLVQRTTNQMGVWFSFDSYYQPDLRGDRMGFSNPAFSGNAFTMSYNTNGQSLAAPIFAASPFAMQILSTNGSPLPGRFFFAPLATIDSPPARRPENSPLSNDVQLVTVTNNSFGRAERLRIRITSLGKDSNGNAITTANATGEDQFGPYLDIGPLEQGASTNMLIRYTVPDGVTLPDPIVRVDWPESLLAGLPSSTFVSVSPQPGQAGQRMLRFNTVHGWNYRVEQATTVSGPWTPASETLDGNDADIDWPIPPNLGPGDHFWQIEVTPQRD